LAPPATFSQCTFTLNASDPCFTQWASGAPSYYSSGGGGGFGITTKSSVAEEDDDLFIFGSPGFFNGYFPKYVEYTPNLKPHWTWLVLKAHTLNRAGTVTLRSADPRDVPEINFHYFDEGTSTNNASGKDYQAVLEGFNFVRNMFSQAQKLGSTYNETFPGTNVKSDADLEHYIKSNSWGHHASCTCPIGADDDPMAVLDSKFRVRGVDGLRVVDASVFPRIPGFFIALPIYMISEKAADVIMQDTARCIQIYKASKKTKRNQGGNFKGHWRWNEQCLDPRRLGPGHPSSPLISCLSCLLHETSSHMILGRFSMLNDSPPSISLRLHS
jgi:choline dehydrogenase